MLPKSFILPNISLINSDRSLIDLKNEYSILNRFQSRDVLANFSIQLETKLPRINKRLKTIQNKQNQLQERQKNLKSIHSIRYMEQQLQYMKNYMLNQQKSNNHSAYCCSRFPSIMPIIYPSMNNNSQGAAHNCKNSNPDQQNTKKPQQQQKNKPKEESSEDNMSKNKNPKKGRNLLKKFRKYAYAVYFCIYLKYFSMKFTKNRYQFFRDRYLSNSGEKVKQDSFKITKSIEVIDLIRIILQSSTSISGFSTLAISPNTTLKDKQKFIPKKQQQKFVKALNFINLYLKQLQKIVLKQKFIQFYAQIIGIGTLNQSFFMDDLMIPQQISIITFSQKKGFANMKPQTEKLLIMIYVLVKHILFKIFLKVKQKKYFQQKIKDQYQKYQDYKDQFEQFLEIVSSILYSLVNSMYLEYIQEHGAVTNYDKLKKRFKIAPAKILSSPECPKKLKQGVNNQELIVGVKKNNQIQNYLQNQKYEEYLGYLVSEIEGLAQNLYTKIKKVNDLIYVHLKQITLDQSYLIFQGMKSEQSQKIRAMKSSKQLQFGSSTVKSPPPTKQLGNRISNTSLGNMSKLFKSNLLNSND